MSKINSHNPPLGIALDEMFAHLQNEDAMGAVLRAHLYLEGLLNELLVARVQDPKALDRMNLMYDRKVDLLAALGLKPSLIAPLKAIGKYRNKFAHDLTGC
jgi:hypothetical protein